MRADILAVVLVRVAMVSLLLSGCGRFGFPTTDDAATDVPIDVIIVGPGTTTFGETPTADVTNVTIDTALSTEIGSTMANYGAATSLGCESNEYTLLRFDLTALAPGTPVTSVQLRLQFSGTAVTATLRPILEAWTEGEQSGTTGVANSIQRTDTANWATAGADAPGSAGAPIASFSATPGANTVALPAATVQGWVDNPSTNFGIRIACSGDSYVVSRDSATATARPQLDVTHQ